MLSNVNKVPVLGHMVGLITELKVFKLNVVRKCTDLLVYLIFYYKKLLLNISQFHLVVFLIDEVYFC